jgi:hypothetical protein
MKQPEYILKDGTKVVTHEKLDTEQGMMISPKHLRARRESMPGIIAGVVPGHGGDVYWVQHELKAEGEKTAAYCFTEFELVE